MVKVRAQTLVIKRARRQKEMKKIYFGYYLPMAEGILDMKYSIKDKKYS